MGWFGSCKKSVETRVELPDGVAQQVNDLGRVLKFEPCEDGCWVVACEFALAVASSSELVVAGLWHEVQFCSWSAETRQLMVVWVEPGRPEFRTVTVSENPREFMKLVTREVERTIVLRRQLRVADDSVVVGMARRRVDGQIFTTVVSRGKVTARTQEAAKVLERQLQAELGLE